MAHLYLYMPDRCGQKIHKSKKDRLLTLSNFTLSVSFTLIYFLPHRSGRQRFKCTIRVQSHDGVFTRRKAENHEIEREWCICVSLSPSLFSALRRIKTLTWDCTLTVHVANTFYTLKSYQGC